MFSLGQRVCIVVLPVHNSRKGETTDSCLMVSCPMVVNNKDVHKMHTTLPQLAPVTMQGGSSCRKTTNIQINQSSGHVLSNMFNMNINANRTSLSSICPTEQTSGKRRLQRYNIMPISFTSFGWEELFSDN